MAAEEAALSPFELAEPRTLGEAFALLSEGDGNVRPMSGGTALMLMMKAGVLRPTRLVSLRRLGLDRLESGPGGELLVGAMVTLRALEKSAQLKDWPVIARTLRTLSNVRVRTVATVGGALAHGDPHMDLPPVLMALDASLTVVGPNGERSLPVESLFTGYYETVLALNELIAFVHVPAQRSKQAAYMKVTTGAVDDWPALGIAAVIVSDGDA